MEEETHPPGGLPSDDGGLIVSVSLGEQQAGRRPGRPDHDPPLETPVAGQGGGVLRELEAQCVHEKADGRVVLTDHDSNQAEVHSASIRDRP